MEESEGRNEERGVLIRKIETKKAQAKQMIKAHQEIIGFKKGKFKFSYRIGRRTN
jgi:hypothetical protein